MWVEPVGVEQATAEPVARYKAMRFQASPIVVDLCAGIGGDTIALADHTPVVSVDTDPGMCRRLRWNAEVYEVADTVLAVQARAESFPIPAGARVHSTRIDGSIAIAEPGASRITSPARRSGHRSIDRVLGGAIKLSPAADFARLFPPGSGCEIDLISLRGECKEATVWFGELAECRRRATRLPEYERPGPTATRSTPSRPESRRPPPGSSTPTRR